MERKWLCLVTDPILDKTNPMYSHLMDEVVHITGLPLSELEFKPWGTEGTTAVYKIKTDKSGGGDQ